MNKTPIFSFRYRPLKSSVRSRYIKENGNQISSAQISVTTQTNKIDITHGSYGGLLFDPRWRAKRVIILGRDKHQCIICGSTFGLQVHHRQYHFISELKQFKPPWDYENHLLISLCEPCHKKGHRLYKVPTLNI